MESKLGGEVEEDVGRDIIGKLEEVLRSGEEPERLSMCGRRREGCVAYMMEIITHELRMNNKLSLLSEGYRQLRPTHG